MIYVLVPLHLVVQSVGTTAEKVSMIFSKPEAFTAVKIHIGSAFLAVVSCMYVHPG
jgi:ABC-type sulfate transport system permease component